MSTATAPATPQAAAAPVRFERMLKSEWTKIRTVRSTIWSLSIMVVAALGFTSLFTWLNMLQWDKATADERSRIVDDPVGFIFGSGFYFAQLAVCVLGVLVIASEYSTGMIRSSLLAVPRRVPMLAAKSIVFAALVFVIGELVAFPSFFIGSAIIHKHVPISLSSPGALRSTVGVGLYLAMLGLFALAIGALIRHSAGAITGVIAFVLVIAPVAQLLPGSLGKHIHAYLPSEAGIRLMTTHQRPGDLLGPWQGAGVFAIWIAVLLGLAIYLLRRRDA